MAALHLSLICPFQTLLPFSAEKKVFNVSLLNALKKTFQCYRPQDLNPVFPSIFLCDFHSNSVSEHLVQKVYPAWASAVTGEAKKSVSHRVLGSSGFSCQET